jgi:hypothetical protein
VKVLFIGEGRHDIGDPNPNHPRPAQGTVPTLAQLKHRKDCTEFRQEVAEKTEVARLGQACPIGFAPFAEQVRNAFGRGS